MDNTPSPDDGKRADRLAFYLLKAVNKANRRYRLFAHGDTILVAVSGGKDSLTLLDLLHRRQRTSRDHLSLIAGLVRTDFHCGSTVSESWLRTWCENRGIPMVVDEVQVAHELSNAKGSKCFRCSWVRRKALFTMADRLGCNKLAFGHNADDIAETTLMNLFYSGRIQRMEAKVSFFDGKLIVIRPLAFIEERDIVPFVQASGFPIQGEPCPEEIASHRTLMKRILRELESEHPGVKRSIYRALEHHDAEWANADESSDQEEPI